MSDSTNDTGESFEPTHKILSFTLPTTQALFCDTLYSLLRDRLAADSLRPSEDDCGVRLEFRPRQAIVHTSHGQALVLVLQQIAPERLNVRATLNLNLGIGFKALESVAWTYTDVQDDILAQLGNHWRMRFYPDETRDLMSLYQLLAEPLHRAIAQPSKQSAGRPRDPIYDKAADRIKNGMSYDEAQAEAFKELNMKSDKSAKDNFRSRMKARGVLQK